MKFVEAEGDTIDAAINAALASLGVTRDRVEIEILANATRGLFGIGGRKARVKATVRAPLSADVVPEPLATSREVRRVVTPDAGVEESATLAVAPVLDSATIEHARQILQDIVERVGVSAQASARTDADRVVLELTGDASGILIGRRGQMLDALEYLVNRIVSRDEGAATHISIDSENYRARRRTALEDLARRMAEQAKKKRKQVALNPMSPRDRRIVHMVLQGERGLTTRSSGKGYYRKLIIIPDGAVRGVRGDA
jgi:spoIIIJ-associated protein